MEKERKGTEAGEMLRRLSRLSGIKKRKLSRYLEQKQDYCLMRNGPWSEPGKGTTMRPLL